MTSCALSIEFHIILVIVLMTIQVFYIPIIFYKLLPMFMIHVSFINITLSLFTCFMPAYSKKMDTGNNCMSSTQIGPTITVCHSIIVRDMCFTI